LTVPLPLPEAPEVTVSQFAPLLTDQLQLAVAVTLTDPLVPANVKVRLVDERE